MDDSAHHSKQRCCRRTVVRIPWWGLRVAALVAGGMLCVPLSSQSSYAADSVIGVRAELYTAACTVTSGADLVIDFGTLYAANLRTAGAASAWVNAPKKIELDCPAGISMVTAKFDGVADGAAMNTFKNGGTAKGVSIELQMQSGTQIAPGASQSVTTVAGKAEYALRARLYAKSGGAEAGTVSSTASFTLSYQ